MDDKILIKAYLNGDHSAFEVLVKKYQSVIARVCYSILRNESMVPDVVQEVFLCAFRGLKKFRGDSSFKTWLYRIAVNETFRYIKKQKRWHSSLEDENLSDDNMPEWTIVFLEKGNSPEKIVLNKQEKALIKNGIDKLGERHRIVLHLHYQEDLSVDEIAEILNIPTGSVKSRLHYARLKLKDYLTPIFKPNLA